LYTKQLLCAVYGLRRAFFISLSPTILDRKNLKLLSLYRQSVFTGSAAAAQGEAEAHRGNHEREDDRRGEASQVH